MWTETNSATDERDIARAMIRLYGRRAELVAQDHAAGFMRSGDVLGYCKWWRVHDLVSQERPHHTADTAH
jgi:hypothetical protein